MSPGNVFALLQIRGIAELKTWAVKACNKKNVTATYRNSDCDTLAYVKVISCKPFLFLVKLFIL